jgi:hypothetical protein
MSTTNYNWTWEHPRFVVDLNGDGRGDVVGIGADGIWSSLNLGEGFATPLFGLAGFEVNAAWRVGDHPRFLVDLNGDGRADIVGFGDAGAWVALGNGDGTFGPARFVLAELGFEKGWNAEFPRFISDLTGDSRPDIIGFGQDGIWIALANGDGSFQPAKLVSGDLAHNSGWRVGKHPRFVSDLTGDGRSDIIGFGDDGAWVALGNGDGSFQSARFVLNNLGFNQGWRVENHPRFVADLTGDGRADIIGFGDDGVWVALGNGDGGFQQARFVLNNLGFNQGWRVDRHPRFVADLTGNGRADIIGFGDDGAWVALGNGNGTFQEARFTLSNLGFNQGWRAADHPRLLADINGDGKPDLVGFGDDGLWVALNNGDGTFKEARFVLADFGRRSNRDLVVRKEIIRDHRPRGRIKHVFVLMLENRSYDHMLGFAEISGKDAATGQLTKADGLKGTEFNCLAGKQYFVTRGAPDVTVAPGHDFAPVLEQLCGPYARYPASGPYPEVNNTGFATSLANEGYGDRGGEIMRCFAPEHVPILTTLAREFAVCDRWFCSMPGPTEPNRMFLSAATSGDWDDSPDPLKEVTPASTLPWADFEFEGGTIFDALDEADIETAIYAGDDYPVVGELDGVSNTFDVEDWDDFLEDVEESDIDARFIHLEPNYFGGTWNTITSHDFGKGNSQHPLGGVAAGERLIKQTYEAIRNSPLWESSMLIITYDEHGGFYDHVAPPEAEPTGSKGSKHGFMFDRLGPRVPTVVVSPYIPKGTVEHRLLEHCSVIKTVFDLCGLSHLKHARDVRRVCGLLHLASLSQARTDTPTKLPDVVVSQVPGGGPPPSGVSHSHRTVVDDRVSLLPATLRVAASENIALEPERRSEIIKRVAAIRTFEEAKAYLTEVAAKMEEARKGMPA